MEDFFRFVHRQDREPLRRSIHKTIHEKTPYRPEFRVMRPDGVIRHVRAMGEVLRTADGRPCRMIGIGLDVTDHMELEQARKVAETRYGQLVEAIEAIVWRGDPASTRFTFVSLAVG
jgi:PAS domain-containing protein